MLFTGAMELVANLAKAQADGRLEERITCYAKPKLLVVDELGYMPLESDAAHLLFQLVSRRYERGAMLITSNRAVSEWGGVFGDTVLATAIPERSCSVSTSLRPRTAAHQIAQVLPTYALDNLNHPLFSLDKSLPAGLP